MTETRALDLAVTAVAMARSGGAQEAEATVNFTRRFDSDARGTQLVSLERSLGRTLSMRLFMGGRKATLATSDLRDASIRAAISAALRAAQRVYPQERVGLPESFAPDPQLDLDLYDAELDARGDETRMEDALALERLVRAADARIVDGGTSSYHDATTTTALANTRGFAAAYAATSATRACAPLALDGQTKRTAYYGTAARALRELEGCEAVARIAARRATELFGARKAPTGRVAVIFERDVAAAVLADIFAAVSAANVAVGNSWLTQRIGERIGSDFVQIADDGRRPGAPGSAPFDAEGVATQRTTVFEAGVLRSFLSDTFYGRQLGVASTGNASGGGVGPTNFALQAGEMSLGELIASTPRGVLVLDTFGFATEHASGIYSRGARGLWIEGGEIAYPVEEFTIAASFPEMLADLDGVANDLRYDSSILAPSFRVAQMSVSGQS